MGYRIEFAEHEGTVRAVVSGKASASQAGWIARDIAEQAKRVAGRELLIDLRRLADRLGALGALLMAPLGPRSMPECRVAVVDVRENDPYYALHEYAARSKGYRLRYFDNPSSALSWLRCTRD